MKLEQPLTATLDCAASVSAAAADTWWLIGSAAMALHGADICPVRDVDLLMSRRDARSLLANEARVSEIGAPDARFRSDVFGRVRCAPLTIEVMGGLHVWDGGIWQEVLPRTREARLVGRSTLFVPSIEELIGMCRLFGRPKDQEREQLLRQLL